MASSISEQSLKQIDQLENLLAEKSTKLNAAEDEIIRLSHKCADLMNKELRADEDNWSLGSAGSFSDQDSPEIKSLKEKLIRLKQNEELYKSQLEVLEHTVKIMVHPSEAEEKERQLREQLKHARRQLDDTIQANVEMQSELDQVGQLKSEVDRLEESEEKKTMIIEDLHEQLAKYEEQKSALMENLNETEKSEQTLRDSLNKSLTGIKTSTTTADNDEIEELKVRENHLLMRLHSIEEKDNRLRDRLGQLETHEAEMEAELGALREAKATLTQLLQQKTNELEVANDINSSQEETIGQLQAELSGKNQTKRLEELETKCANMKELLKQKMEELQHGREVNKEQEQTIFKLQAQVTSEPSQKAAEDAIRLAEELQLAQESNQSQESTIRELQQQIEAYNNETGLTMSYADQLEQQLNADDNEEYLDEIAQLKDEIEVLNKKLEESDEHHSRALSDLKSHVSTCQSELKKSESRLKIAQNVIEELKAQNRKLQEASKTANFEEQIKELNAKLQREKVQNSAHRDVIASMSPEIDRLRCENESNEEATKAYEEKMKAKDLTLSKLKSESDSSRAKISTLEKQLVGMQTSGVELNNLRQSLEQKKIESDNLAVDLIEMGDKNASLEKQISALQSNLTSALNEKDSLQNQCEEFRQKISSSNDDASEIVNLRAELEQKSNQYNEAASRLEELEANLVSLTAEKAEYAEKLSGSEGALESAHASMSEADKKIENLKGVIIALKSTVQELENENEIAEHAEKKSCSSCEELQAVIDRLEDELSESHSLFDKIQSENLALKQDGMDIERASITDSTDPSLADSDDSPIEHLKQEVYRLTQENTNLKSRLDCMVGDVDSVLSEKQVYLDELSEKAEVVRRLDSDIAQAKSDYQILDEKNRELVITNNGLNSKFTSDIETYNQTICSLGEQVAELTKENNTLRRDIDSVSVTLSDISSEHKDSDRKVLSLTASLADSEKAIEALKQRLASAEQSAMDCRKCKVSEFEMAKVQRELATLASEKEALIQSLEEEKNRQQFVINRQTAKHEQEINNLNELLECVKDEREGFKQKVAENKKTHDNEYSVLQREYTDLRNALSELQSEHMEQYTSSVSEVSILRAQNDNLNGQLRSQMGAVDTLKSLANELRDRLKREETAHGLTSDELSQTSLTLQKTREEQMTAKEKLQHTKEKLERKQQQYEELIVELEQVKIDHAAKHNDLHVELKALRDEVVRLSAIEGELRSRANSMTSHFNTERETAVALKLQISKLKEEATEEQRLLDENESLATQVADLKNAIVEKERKLLDTLQELNSLKADPPNGSSSTLAQSSDTEGFLSVVQSESALLSAEIQSLQQEKEEALQELQRLKEGTNLREKDNANLRERCRLLVEDSEARKESLEVSENRVDELTNNLNTMESSIHALKDELNDSRQQNVTMLQRVGTGLDNVEKDEEIQRLSDANRSLNDAIVELEIKLSVQNEQADDHLHLIGELRQQIEELSSQSNNNEGGVKQDKAGCVQSAAARTEASKLADTDGNVKELMEKMEVLKTYNAASELAIKDKVTALNIKLKDKESQLTELREKYRDLQEKYNDFTRDESDEDEEEVIDYRIKWQQARNQIEALEFDYNSMEAKLNGATQTTSSLSLELSSIKAERDRLMAQVKASPRRDETNEDGVAYIGLQKQITELKKKMAEQTKQRELLEGEKSDFDRKIQMEVNRTAEMEQEVQKLQISIDLLMSSHKTEIESLQKALNRAGTEVSELRIDLDESGEEQENMKTVLQRVRRELSDIQSVKAEITSMLNNLVSQNAEATSAFQDKLQDVLKKIAANQTFSQQEKATTADIDPSVIASSPQPLLTSSFNDFEMTSPRMTYTHLTKEDLVLKLAEQTKHEMSLKHSLEEARQSLNFYRAAIDNIVDCLGNNMPGIKKLATDILSTDDGAFARHLDELVSNESALQRRCHALEMSEKALTENFNTREKEYQHAIQRLEDMVSILKTSKARLADELKTKSSKGSVETEEKLEDLKEKVYQLENTIQRLHQQNEELQYALDQECERRQIQEEERFKAEQKSRMQFVDSSRETDFLSKMASLETKIRDLHRQNSSLEQTIDKMKSDSPEDDLRTRIETLERSERALQRKIEILQVTNSQSNEHQYENTLDRPEDLLRQRIWELEKMETHLKQQLSDLEHDREELHEIARTDKNAIHELNIQLTEQNLAVKNLKAQVARFEQAEESLYNKLDSAEARVVDLEEKLNEALDNEKTMRYQLEDSEFSEDSLRFKTTNLEKTIESMQAAETTLKRQIDDLNRDVQNRQLEVLSFNNRVQVYEDEQTNLRNKLFDMEKHEIELKGKISEVQTVRSSMESRISELERENERLTTQLLSLERSTSDIRNNAADTFLGRDDLNRQIQNLRSYEQQSKARIASLETEKFELEKSNQDTKFELIQLRKQVNKDSTDGATMTERLTAALKAENRARSEIHRLEAVIAVHETRASSGITERENFQLNAELKNLREKLREKEKQIRDLESKVHHMKSTGGPNSGGTYRINKLQTEIGDLQAQLRTSEDIRADLVNRERTLEETVSQLRANKNLPSCGHEREIKLLKEQLASARTKAQGLRAYHDTQKVKRETASNFLLKKIETAPADVRTRVLAELVEKVQTKEQSIDTPDNQPRLKKRNERSADHSSSDLEIESESSLWEKLEPPKRKSPTSVPGSAQQPQASLDSDSSTTESNDFALNLNEAYGDSADEMPGVAELASPSKVRYIDTSSSLVNIPLSPQATQLVETKEIAKLKLTVQELERKLTSRETEIKMLTGQLKEIERDTNLSGDKFMMKTKLKMLQDQLERSEKRITSLRDEIISKDRLIDGRQKEVITLKVELRKAQEAIKSMGHEQEKEKTRGGLSPGSRQRPIQMCTSPGRQTTIERDPSALYKSMIESKDSHIAELNKQLNDKKAKVVELERELVDLKLAQPTGLVQTSSAEVTRDRFRYLDERYTETAARCVEIKNERDGLQAKYDVLVAEHARCAIKPERALPSQGLQVSKELSRACEKCLRLKKEIKLLQKELNSCRKKLASKVTQSHSETNQSDIISIDTSVGSNTTMTSQTTQQSSPLDYRELVSNDHSLNGSSSTIIGDSSTSTNQAYHHSPNRATRSYSPRYYEVISDYNPEYFSTSGYKEKECKLTRGQAVRVIGQPSEQGYCEAEVDGKVHLVPYKYLCYNNNKRSPDAKIPHETMSQSYPPTAHISSNIRVQPIQPQMRTPPNLEMRRKPRVPGNLKVEVVASQKMFIEWSYVDYLDEHCRSNGTIVKGYRVYLNGKEHSVLESAYFTVTSVDVTPQMLSELHTVSVQAVGERNINSPLAHKSVSIYLNADRESSLSQSPDSVSNTKRLFMAYYDYDPLKQGPYSRGAKKSCRDELCLKTGDFVVVTGKPRPDGFYNATIEGKRGLVPEAFIRLVPAANARHYGFHHNDVPL